MHDNRRLPDVWDIFYYWAGTKRLSIAMTRRVGVVTGNFCMHRMGFNE